MLIFGVLAALGVQIRRRGIAPKVTESLTLKPFLLPMAILIPTVLGIMYQQNSAKPEKRVEKAESCYNAFASSSLSNNTASNCGNSYPSPFPSPHPYAFPKFTSVFVAPVARVSVRVPMLGFVGLSFPCGVSWMRYLPALSTSE